ncbi:MAG: transketolase [Tannerellaceae bacterium]|jgi:transketolase|nr:transketolase [Tannerellaceae bacterium]
MNSQELAWRIRRHGVEMTHLSKGSHIGAILSVADIVGVLYADILRIDPSSPKKEDRDRFILSKGHAGAAIYAALAERGFFPVQELATHYANGSRLSGHVSHKGVPGVDFSTGSLGHGLSVGVGMALSAKLDRKSYRIYVVIGDGECDEGAVWEASMFAHHHKLDKLTVIVDYNKMQSLTFCEDTLSLNPLDKKFEAFGYNVLNVDGHNHLELKDAFHTPFDNGNPTLILAHTIKGKGVSFMENNILWHYRTPQGDEYEAAVKELEDNSYEGYIC